MRSSIAVALRRHALFPLVISIAPSLLIHVAVAWYIASLMINRLPLRIAVKPYLVELSGVPSDLDSGAAQGRKIVVPAPTRSVKISKTSNRQPEQGFTASASAGDESRLGPAYAVGLGNAATDAGGIPIAGGGSSEIGVGPVGQPFKGGGTDDSSAARGTGRLQSDQSRAGPAQPARPPTIPAIVIPPAINYSTASHEGAVYYEVDTYVLFAPDTWIGVAIPGNEICLQGDQIRTIVPYKYREHKTDISKCQFLDYGEDRREECAPDAHTILRQNYYLSSPVNYKVNSCLIYDRSNCEWRREGDGRDQQVCKGSVEYKGIWAANTEFHYHCVKSESRAYIHPLQFEVRFFRDVEYQERTFSKRLLLRESRSIIPCH